MLRRHEKVGNGTTLKLTDRMVLEMWLPVIRGTADFLIKIALYRTTESRTGRIGGTGRTGRLLDRVVLGTQTGHLGGLEAPFWYPGPPF